MPTPDIAWIDLEGAVNARTVVSGVLLRSDNLQGLSPRDIRALIDDHALETVIDLRTDIEVRREGPGPLTGEPAVQIAHHSLYPDAGVNTDFDAETVRPWGPADDHPFPDEPPVVRAYMSYLQRRPDSVVAAVQAIARADGAVLVHCAAGKDRTGVVVAIALDAAGVSRSTIVADYLATADRIGAILDRLLASPTYRSELEGTDLDSHRPPPGVIERVLGLLDEHSGGSAAWLSDHGLSSADLTALGQRLGG